MVSAVLSKVLLRIMLVSYIQCVVNEEVDINTLFRIQRFFHNNYENGQYAVAINVPKEQCRGGFVPSINNFLTNDKWEDVNPYIKPNSKDIYIGSELIAAGFHVRAHSEHLLMNPPKSSPFTNLLNIRKDGCVVFYTLLAPCIDQCLSSKVILAGLDKMQMYQGIKAFVYTHIYRNDQNNPNLRKELQKVAYRVPLYRCGIKGCIPCGNNVIDECLNS